MSLPSRMRSSEVRVSVSKEITRGKRDLLVSYYRGKRDLL
jgi:hypothetical protein